MIPLTIAPPLADLSPTRTKRGAVVIRGVNGYHQLDKYSCGAAVVATVLAAYIGWLCADSWQRIVSTTDPCPSGGTPARRVMKSLREFGFSPQPIKFTPAKVGEVLAAGDLLVTSLRMPSQAPDETHWVVIAGASDEEALALNCTGLPLFSKRWKSWEEIRELQDPGDRFYRIDTGLKEWVADQRCNSSESRVIRFC